MLLAVPHRGDAVGVRANGHALAKSASRFASEFDGLRKDARRKASLAALGALHDHFRGWVTGTRMRRTRGATLAVQQHVVRNFDRCMVCTVH